MSAPNAHRIESYYEIPVAGRVRRNLGMPETRNEFVFVLSEYLINYSSLRVLVVYLEHVMPPVCCQTRIQFLRCPRFILSVIT
jgi:hypothetical protein